METNVQIEDVIADKARELCETLVRQPQFREIRQQVDRFMADANARKQYEELSEKGRQLHHKQHQGVELSQSEIAAFDQAREAFLGNPAGKGFVEAQEAMHHIQETIGQYVGKTLELGRVPTAEELSEGGSCGEGCGCHH